MYDFDSAAAKSLTEKLQMATAVSDGRGYSMIEIDIFMFNRYDFEIFNTLSIHYTYLSLKFSLRTAFFVSTIPMNGYRIFC